LLSDRRRSSLPFPHARIVPFPGRVAPRLELPALLLRGLRFLSFPGETKPIAARAPPGPIRNAGRLLARLHRPPAGTLKDGSDGASTRDLRRDRPVLVSPGGAGIDGDSRREQALSTLPLRDLRAPAGASGGLLRDLCGMRRCRCCNRRELCGTGARHEARGGVSAGRMRVTTVSPNAAACELRKVNAYRWSAVARRQGHDGVRWRRRGSARGGRCR
jgi:hypothetical protein